MFVRLQPGHLTGWFEYSSGLLLTSQDESFSFFLVLMPVCQPLLSDSEGVPMLSSCHHDQHALVPCLNSDSFDAAC